MKLFLIGVFAFSALLHAQDRNRSGVQVTQPSVRITSPKIVLSGPDVVIGGDTKTERTKTNTHYHCCNGHHDNGKHKGHYKHKNKCNHHGGKKHRCH